MTIKLLLLKSGEDIIADTTEMTVGEDEDRRVVGYFLTKPCVVKLINSNPITKEETDPKSEKKSEFSVTMYPWMPLAREKSIPLTVDWVVTMVTPVEKIYDMYTEDVLNDGQTTEKTSDTDK